MPGSDQVIPHGDPRQEDWDAWRPADVARLLAGVRTPWWVAAGWAIELWRGEPTRPHKDIEVCVPRQDWPEVRERVAGHDLWYAEGHDLRRLAPGTEVPEPHRQVWVRDRESGVWRVDIHLDPGDREEWVSHRDPRLRRPLAEAVATTPDGIPYLRPEIVLLLKAKQTRPKDEVDFDASLPLLDPAARRWLAAGLALLHPDHRWMRRV
jgi:hypothetical protein